MTVEKVERGRALFFDPQLSRNGTQSCSSCHQPEQAFTDGRSLAVGSTGQSHRRNAQGLINVAYASTLTWANPLLGSLEQQALIPLFGEDPVELGWAGHEDELLARFQGETLQSLTQALAAHERSLISSGSAPYDRWVAGDASAMSDDARAGFALINDERLECYHCHAGFSFSDSVTHASKSALERPFHNTGLYDVDGLGGYPLGDTGLIEVTGRVGDMGRFRAPSLRNLGHSAPYMHDGSLATLDEVLDAYAAGGHAKQVGGTPSPLQDGLVRGFTLSADERRQLLAFFAALDDPL